MTSTDYNTAIAAVEVYRLTGTLEATTAAAAALLKLSGTKLVIGGKRYWATIDEVHGVGLWEEDDDADRDGIPF